jgi:hypothetical protein
MFFFGNVSNVGKNILFLTLLLVTVLLKLGALLNENFILYALLEMKIIMIT